MNTSESAHNPVIRDIALIIRDRLDAGLVPWRSCWSRLGGLPRNFLTQRPYRGVNLFMLAGTAFKSPWWLSERQARFVGGFVREGEHPTRLYFWSFRNQKNPKAWPFHVFNLEQTYGLEDKTPFRHLRPRRLDTLLANMPNAPRIVPGKDFLEAGYWPKKDLITMPLPQLFPPNSRHVHELFRQIIHATGHPERLNRYNFKLFDMHPFYLEGLCAELGASILCAETGVKIPELANEIQARAAWSLALQGNPLWFPLAAHQAQKAVDYTLTGGRPRRETDPGLNHRVANRPEPNTALAPTG